MGKNDKVLSFDGLAGILPNTFSTQFGLDYPEDLEESIGNLKQHLARPSSAPKSTLIEFILHNMEEEAKAITNEIDDYPRGADGQIVDLYNVRIESAFAIPKYAKAIQDATRDGNFESALINMMYFTAAAIKLDLHRPAMRGLHADRSTRKGGFSSGSARREEIFVKHKKIADDAKARLNAGSDKRNLAANLSKIHGYSPNHIRTILKKNGIL